MNDQLTRIGVFYDGNYFLQVSNYYAYGHPRQKRLSVSGLHEFIRHHVALEESSDVRLCKIVDSHYFRGRLSASEASQRGDTLYWDRVFDDILMSEGVITHYLPLKTNYDGTRAEKGIDVWLALEVFEQTFYKRFDVVVLISADGDYVPLVRKLNAIGTRVVVLGWDFEYQSETGQRFVTRTSHDLLEEASYPIHMNLLIDDRGNQEDPIINKLFVQSEPRRAWVRNSENENGEENPAIEFDDQEVFSGEILKLKNGFGFIKFPPNNLFFHYTNVIETEFNELQEGDMVSFNISKNERGEDVARNIRFVSQNHTDY